MLALELPTRSTTIGTTPALESTVSVATANCTVTGWAGRSRENSEVSPVLRLVAVAVIQPLAGMPAAGLRLESALPSTSVVTVCEPSSVCPWP